jgi:predicted dehydrogenase
MTLSRREFLERSMFAAAAAAAAESARSASAAAPAESGNRVGPNDKIRVAVIGVNGQGGHHVGEYLRCKDADLVAICDVDPAAYKKIKDKHGDKLHARYEQDIRKLLEDKNIDAVSIATPNHWHALAAVWAMQAGKDVYVEKPCSHNVREGRVMTEFARKLGRICQMGAQSRSMTGMRQAIEFVRSGKIGKVSLARAMCHKRRKAITGGECKIPDGLDFDLWAGPAPKVVPARARLHYDWHWFWETGNGDLGNQNPHELDKARWGIGKQELPKRVVSLGGRLGYVDGAETANSQITFLDFGDAMIISEVRGLENKSPVTYGLKGGDLRAKGSGNVIGNIFYGTDGYVVCPNYTSGTAFDLKGQKIAQWGGGDYQAHFANFLKAVRSRKHTDLHLDIEDGHLSSALAHLGNVSLRMGKPVPADTKPSGFADNKTVVETLASFEEHLKENGVDFSATKFLLGAELKIDPATELSDDAEANKLFTREYRKGFELPQKA